MSMQRYRDVLQDLAGNVIPDATVAVVLTGTTTPATLYSDAAGNYPLAGNTVTSNERGEFGFYADPGVYDLSVTATGYTPFTLTGIDSIGVGEFAAAGDNSDITSLTSLHQVAVTDTGAPTGSSDALVDVQGLEVTWHYNARRRDTGFDSRAGNDGKGWSFEHPIRTTLFGRTLTLDDSIIEEIGTLHQGSLLRAGTTEAGSHLLDFISNAGAGGITTSVVVQAVTYDVTLSPSSGGDLLDGSTDAIVLKPGQSAMLSCDSVNGWRSYRIGGNAQLKTIAHAAVGGTVGVPGRDLYYVPDYDGGSYWVPNALGQLVRLGANNGQQATEIVVANLRLFSPLAAGLYCVTDFPATKGSLWANYGGQLDPLGGRCKVARVGTVALVANMDEQAGLIGFIPAGVLKAGYTLSCMFAPGKTGIVDTMKARVRIGVDPLGLYPNTEIFDGVNVITSRSDGQWVTWDVVNTTTLRRMFGQGSNDLLGATSIAAVADFTIPDVSAVDLYVSISVQITTAGGETPSLLGGMIEIWG